MNYHITYENAWWVSRTRETFHISDMSREHIEHCIRKIQRENFRPEWLDIMQYELELRNKLEEEKRALKKVNVKHFKEIDKDELFGKKLSSLISFLQCLQSEHGDVMICECWEGYEDNYFGFYKVEEETDFEFEEREIFTIKELRHKYEQEFNSKYKLINEKIALQEKLKLADEILKTM